jgi:hypothetical protein
VAGSIAAWLWSPAGSARLPVLPYGLLRLAPPVVSLLVLPIGPTLTQDLALPMPAAAQDATLYFQAAFLDPRDLSVHLSKPRGRADPRALSGWPGNDSSQDMRDVLAACDGW